LELERSGVVTKRHGTGTYVSEGRAPLPHREKLKILASRADALLTEARHLDVGLAEVVKLLRDRDGLMDLEEVRQ
jgi:DNA-binding transcriptional regulator YhcF (GntR family)